MTWQQVAAIHRGHGGVSIRGGRVVSLLAIEGSRYRNEITRSRIRYGISAQRSRHQIKAFQLALEEHHPIRVFYRSASNVWEDLGTFEAVSVEKVAAPETGGLMLYYTMIRGRGEANKGLS